MTFRFILKSSGVLRDESAEPSARGNLSQNLTKQSSSLRLVLGSRSQGFNLKVPGCALKVLACRAFEPALAGIPLVTIHACHAHVPATPWTRTPGDGLVAWGSELSVVHQALAVLGIRSIYAWLVHKAVQYCSLQNGLRPRPPVDSLLQLALTVSRYTSIISRLAARGPLVSRASARVLLGARGVLLALCVPPPQGVGFSFRSHRRSFDISAHVIHST
jgi:hypothetical protein